MQAVASGLFVVGLIAVGWGPARLLASTRDAEHEAADEGAWSLVLAALAGSLLVTATLWLLQPLGITWSQITVLGVMLGLGVLSWWLTREHRTADGSLGTDARGVFASLGLDVWMLPALGAPLAFAVPTFLQWNVHPDFIYHWGQKAAHNHLLGGVDYGFLSRPWNGHLHPDYPNMMPTLNAAATLIEGEIRWWPTALLAILWFTVLTLALCSIARRACASDLGRSAAAGVAIWTAAAFAIGFRQAGGADLPLCAAVAAGVALLMAQPSRRLDGQMAIVAAFAAATKIEGIALAALMLGVYVLKLGVDALHSREPIKLGFWVRRLAVLATPMALMVGYWLFMVMRFDLFLESNTAELSTERLSIALAALWDLVRWPIWHGSTVAFAALPILLLSRRDRWAALMLAGQLGFYIYAYAAGPVDTRHWIETSGARLLFHLLPSLWVLSLGAIDRWSSSPAKTPQPSPTATG